MPSTDVTTPLGRTDAAAALRKVLRRMGLEVHANKWEADAIIVVNTEEEKVAVTEFLRPFTQLHITRTTPTRIFVEFTLVEVK
jgi:hypothetical protein